MVEPAREFASALVSECAMAVQDVALHVVRVVLAVQCGRQQ